MPGLTHIFIVGFQEIIVSTWDPIFILPKAFPLTDDHYMPRMQGHYQSVIENSESQIQLLRVLIMVQRLGKRKNRLNHLPVKAETLQA